MPCEHVKCDGHQVLPKAVIKGPLKRLDLQFSETFIREVLTWNPATRQKNLSTQKKKKNSRISNSNNLALLHM